MGPKLLLLFIIGDILGAGVYAVTGQMAGTVGGVVWLPFLLAFVVATLTALSYLELVTKYPQAAGRRSTPTRRSASTSSRSSWRSR
jgi:APA family basic amino acid/polyamine antiporter